MNVPQLVERKFLFDANQPITAPLYEVAVAANGVFRRARRKEMTAILRLESFAAPINELANEIERVELVQKIPGSIFAEILTDARQITDSANFTENLYAVCWDAQNNRYLWREISRSRTFGSTIARDADGAYQTAILEIHTHPPGCYKFSSADDRDERGKFRLFGILIDIHTEQPKIRLRAGVYDSFCEIETRDVTNDLPAEFADLVEQEKQTCITIYEDFGAVQGITHLFVDKCREEQAIKLLENL